jgi:hypothetical protein
MPARRKKRLHLVKRFPYVAFSGSDKSGRACKAKLILIERNLLRAMETADNRGYTGMVRSRGALFDDPKVKTLMRRRDALMRKC